MQPSVGKTKQRLADLRRAHPVTAVVLAVFGVLGFGAAIGKLAHRSREAWVQSQGSNWIFLLRMLGRDREAGGRGKRP